MSESPTPGKGEQQPSAGANPAGAPADAVAAFEAGLAAGAKAAPTATADGNVSLAFALGWQMAELFRTDLRRHPERRDGDLPGLGSLSDEDRREISVDQIQAALTHLTPVIQAAGLTVPGRELVAVRDALSNWQRDGQRTVESLHHKLLGTLTAADFRLGKSYGLGRALADTCRKPTDLAAVKSQLSPFRIATLLAWLDELSTALPAHAAHSVYTSLKQWSDWAAAENLPGDVVRTIKRQGELWRALLSGEKRGTEMLEADNYLKAAGSIARRMSAIFRKTIGRLWWLVAGVLILLGGTAVLFAVGGASHLVAGAGTLLAAVGLTWKGLGGTLGKLVGKLEQPLWGAVLDSAIAAAITLNPANKADGMGRTKLAVQLATGPEPAEADAASSSDS